MSDEKQTQPEPPRLASWSDAIKADEMSGPHCWIQWKGTAACMDFHCACGYHGHVDAQFAYNLRCGECGEVFAVGQNVRLYRLAPEEQAAIAKGGACMIEVAE